MAAEVRARLLALVSADAGEGDSEADPGLTLIEASASTVSLASMLTEISRLEAVRAIGLPAGLFADAASRPGTPREVHTGTVNEPGRRVARSLALLHGGDDLGRACRGSRA
jgi:hypothetical protein